MAFNGAHDITMQDPTFNIYQNHPTPSFVDPARILRQAQAVEALHTSATVGYISKCHPGTREKVTIDIVDCVIGAAGADQGSAPRKAILWFSGPAGGGKTSIMRGVVDRCGAKGLSTVSYFFSARGSGVTSVRPFVATIVRQLVALDPILGPIIYNSIRDLPTIFEESLEEQIERVLVEPLHSPAFQSQLPPRRIVIAVDGLDECLEEREREQLLDILRSLVIELPPIIVVVIASRPEFDLRRAFDKPKLSNVAKFIKLHDYDGSNDIRVFVCDALRVIRQSHPLRRLIPESWPFEEIVQLLVDKSSSNFIIPVTAMKYIERSRRNPVESLNIIVGVLKNPLPSSKPFADLDALYTHILHPPETDLHLMRRILHCIIGVTAAGSAHYVSSLFLDKFLELTPGTTATTLCDLHSILHIPEPEDDPIRFHHKSLIDYLLDPERSSDFFQSTYETQLDLTVLCATHLARWGRNPVVDLSDRIQYSVLYWDGHLGSCINHKPVSATLPDIIMKLDPRNGSMHRFIHGYPSHRITKHMPKALHAALCSGQQCVRLCQLVLHMRNCLTECEAFAEPFRRGDVDGRLEALSRFKFETGLFAPPYPDSHVAFNREGFGQLVRRGRLDGRDEDGQLYDGQAGAMGARMDDSGRSAIAAGDGRSSSFPPRQELSHTDTSPSTVPPPAPSFPPNLVSRPSRWHRFVAWMGRSKRTPRS